MDNRILNAYEEFAEKHQGLPTPIFFVFAYAFKAGVEAEKKRVINEVFGGEHDGSF